MISEAVLTAFLVAAFSGAIPLLLAAIGESVGEQAGVLNIGLEGLMLVGGFFGFATTYSTGSFWLGFLAGALAGAALAAVMALLAVCMRANQIVVGIGLTLAGGGVTSLLFERYFADSAPRLGAAGALRVPWLSDLPVVGAALFSQHGMFTAAFAIAACTSLWLSRTAPGLRLRAAGQNPASLDAVGGRVLMTRSLAVLFGGVMAGLGGAYLALISAGTFTPYMTHGLGFLAIVVAMLARGRQLWVVLVSVTYGLFTAAGTALQLGGSGLSTEIITMLPFIAVLVALVLFGRRASALPPALATAYERGQR